MTVTAIDDTAGVFCVTDTIYDYRDNANYCGICQNNEVWLIGTYLT